MESESSPLLRIPAEIRLLIYGYLFNDKGNSTIAIRNRSRAKQIERSKSSQCRWSRSTYRVIEQSFHRVCFETTYQAESSIDFSTVIMRVNRKIYGETTDIVYGRHCFDFGPDVEAVMPFFQDRFCETRPQIQHISIQKRLVPLFEGSKYDWTRMLHYLGSLETLRKLTIVLEGGRPNTDWNGPKELSVSDLRLLWQIKHDSMEWVAHLEYAAGTKQVEIIPKIGYMPVPTTSSALVQAALSASISSSLVEFLRSELKLPATLGRWGEPL